MRPLLLVLFNRDSKPLAVLPTPVVLLRLAQPLVNR